jgi:hypothetical protein
MKGGGKPLKDGAPFVSITVSVLESGGSVDGFKAPNTLCKQCHSIFKKDIGVRGDSVLQIDPQKLSGCRLCALLVFRLYNPKTMTFLEVEYYLDLRYGYIMDVHDLIFYRRGEWLGSLPADHVRLGVQWKRQTGELLPAPALTSRLLISTARLRKPFDGPI